MHVRRFILLSCVLGVSVFVELTDSVSASEDCTNAAVSKLTAEFSAAAGYIDNSVTFDSALMGSASSGFALPLTCSLGFQTDSVVEFNGEAWMVGVDAQLFLRDPNIGMLGGAGAYTNLELDDGDKARLLRATAAEAELYLDRLTIFLLGGHVGGNGTRDGALGMGGLSWYFTDDLVARGAVLYTKGSGPVAKIGMETKPDFLQHFGGSLFADAEFGDDDYRKILVGLEFNFNTSGSLQDRDRSERLPHNLAEELTSISYTYENK